MIEILNDNNGRELLEENEQLVVVDFFATRCVPCRQMAPTLEALAEANAGKVTFYKCDVDEAEELSRDYGIQSIPTLVFMEQGREVERIAGLTPQHELQAIIDGLLK